MSKVCVWNQEGAPLMPCHPARARQLLRAKKAVVVCREPFTIQLQQPCENAVQPITVGIDPGSGHVGISVSTEKEEFFAGEFKIRQDIPRQLTAKRMYRNHRRSRLRYRAPRFNNRVHNKKEGWLPPSLRQKKDTMLHLIRKIARFLPVHTLAVEVGAFDIQKLNNPDISGKEYQESDRLAQENARCFVLRRDSYTCQHCGKKSEEKKPLRLEAHHIVPRSKGGSNRPDNLITLCESCHKALHQGKFTITQQNRRTSPRKHETAMNVVCAAFIRDVEEQHPELELVITYGYITSFTRKKLGLPKTHYVDAFCIAGNLDAKRCRNYVYFCQVRKHNRKIYKDKTLKGGVRKRHQGPYTVFGFRLYDKVRVNGKETGFIMGRRSNGSFVVRKLDGTVISNGISYKKLTLVEKRRTFLYEVRKKEFID